MSIKNVFIKIFTYVSSVNFVVSVAENLNFCRIFVLHESLSVTGDYINTKILADEYSTHNLGLWNIWTSHITYKSVISLLGLSLSTSKYSPVPGAWQRISAILSLVSC
jgi:hypothetical protein